MTYAVDLTASYVLIRPLGKTRSMKQLICIEERTFRELCSRIEMLSQLAERLQSKLKLLHPEVDRRRRGMPTTEYLETDVAYVSERGVLPFSSIEEKRSSGKRHRRFPAIPNR